ncbi:MAG: hypothetical protein Q9191_006466 [Dirinaria sp. TL-2023a]
MAPAKYDIAYQQAHIHQDRRKEMIVSHAVLMSLAATAVALRFLSRRIKAGYHADDWMMLVALILTAGECTGVLYGVIGYDSAKHAMAVKDPVANGKASKLSSTKVKLCVYLLYNTGISCVKFSALLMYRRIFPNRRFHIALWCVGGFIFTYSFIQFCAIMFQCIPIHAAWDGASGDAKCIHLMLELEIMGILNALTDIVTVCLPMPLLHRLQMPWKQKWQVLATFLVGGFVCIVSIWRVPMEAGISLIDASYTDVTGCIWSFIELSVAIICGCLPTLRPLLRLGVGLFTSQRSTGSSEGNIMSPSLEKEMGVKVVEVSVTSSGSTAPSDAETRH